MSLRFSHPVDPAEVSDALLFETASGQYVASEALSSAPGRRVVVRLPFSLDEARSREVALRSMRRSTR
ncbi:MAG: Ig-like domain-containing protein [Myxococcales bacterium]|nr:Ig-like domain-containing protein [Myxococcales bacterium]